MLAMGAAATRRALDFGGTALSDRVPPPEMSDSARLLAIVGSIVRVPRKVILGSFTEQAAARCRQADTWAPTLTPPLRDEASFAALALASWPALVLVAVGYVRPGTSYPPLTAIFEIRAYPFALVLAAVFGYTPSLLLNRLNRLAEQYAVELRSSEPGSATQRA